MGLENMELSVATSIDSYEIELKIEHHVDHP